MTRKVSLRPPAEHKTARTDAELVDQLATRVIDLGKNQRIDPEAFHVEKNEIAVQLRRLAKRMRGEPERPQPTTIWRPGR